MLAYRHVNGIKTGAGNATPDQIIREISAADILLDEKKNVLYTKRGGTRIEYTIDPKLQSLAEQLLQRYNPVVGTFVAIEPGSGAVRVMAVYTRNMKQHYAEHPYASIIAPAARTSTYPMASIAKIITASAALKHGLYRPSDIFKCTGRLKAGGGTVFDPVGVAHGDISMADALAKSCNTTFGRIALKLGAAKLQDEFLLYGFNRAIDFELPVLESMAEVSEEKFGLARAGAGFEGAFMSPLHAALIAAAVRNSGVMMKPFIVATVSTGGAKTRTKPAVAARPAQESVAASISKMMEGTVNETGGTAYRGFYKNGRGITGKTRVHGKTGSLNGNSSLEYYTWFVGFTVEGEPDLAVSTMILNDDKWEIKAASYTGQFYKFAARRK